MKKVKALVAIQIEGQPPESIEVDLEARRGYGGTFQISHPALIPYSEHYNLGLAVLDLLRIAIIQFNPDWCKHMKYETPQLESGEVSLKSGAELITSDARTS